MPRMKANRLPNMLAFNGSSDYLTLPIVPAVTGFNLAFWSIKRNQVDGNRVIEWADAGYSKGFTIIEKTVAFELSTRDSGTTATLLSSAKPNARLVHIAATHDGTTLKLYENGVLVGTDAAAAYTAPTAAFTIAREAGFSGNFWNGLMGELVFHSTATPWTQAQITDLYASGTIPSGASYWLFNGNVLDGSGNGNNGTLTGGTYVYQNAGRITPRFMGGSTLFNGSTSKINTTLNITDYNAITVSFWYKQSRYVSDVRLLANGHTDADNTGFMFWIVANKILFHVGNGIANVNAQSVSEIARDISGKWIHCIGTYNGTVVRLYLNGVLSSNDATSTLSGNIANTAYPVAIGYNPVFNGGYSNGKLSEVKIFNSALTASQAAELYSTGSVSGVSPVYSDPLDEQPSTYTDTIGGVVGTGTATTYSSDTPIQQRMAVVDDMASLAYSSISTYIDIGTAFSVANRTAFTVGAIVYVGSDSNQDIVTQRRSGNGYLGAWRLTVNNKKFEFYGFSTGGGEIFNCVSAVSVVPGRWYTLTAVFDPVALKAKLFVNGLIAKSVTAAGSGNFDNTIAIGIGKNFRDGNNPFIGKMAKFYMWNGEALTNSEVAAIHFNRTIKASQYLKCVYEHNEGSGSTLTDSSGNGNNGTITGATWSSDTPSEARVVATGRTSV